MSGSYDDIIDLPHPVSTRHPHMPVPDRAAQFAPFAALTGYEAAICETARQTDQKAEQEEDAKMVLDQKQQILLHSTEPYPPVSVTYFKPDIRKSGGSYVTVSGQFQKIDALKRLLILTDKTSIPLDDILELESTLFSDLF